MICPPDRPSKQEHVWPKIGHGKMSYAPISFRFAHAERKTADHLAGSPMYIKYVDLQILITCYVTHKAKRNFNKNGLHTK